MTPQEMINSGLLELYALGQLEGEELRSVESAIESNAAVRSELREIEEAMGIYAAIHALPADQSILNRALDQINQLETAPTDTLGSSEPIKASSIRTLWSWLGPLSAIAAGVAMMIAYIQFDKVGALTDEMDAIIADCEENEKILQEQEAMYAALMDEDNRPVLIEPTTKYPDTRLIIHHNKTEGVNYLQISNLPSLSDGLAFQLWSLKGTDTPIPLTVFTQGGEVIIPIDYEPDTDAYAITIEPTGGSQSPNLDELIGVFTMG